MHTASKRTSPRAALPLVVIATLLAVLALVVVPADRAFAYNGSASPCALQGTTGGLDEGQQTDYTKYQQPKANITIGVVYVDFPDIAGVGSVGDYYNALSPAANWVWTASYGHTWLNMQASLNQWVRMPSNSTDYGFPNTPTYAQHSQYVRDALQAAANAGANLAAYDMFYIIPTNYLSINRSTTWFWTPTSPNVVINGTTIHWAVTFGTDMWTWNHRYLVAAHETAHTFGWPDLYAYSGTQHRFVGGWDVMGNINGPAPQYFGWETWKNHWIEDSQVACVSQSGTQNTLALTAVEYSGGNKLLVVRTSATTAYVAESRRAVYNDPTPCSTGVAIYKVDTSAAAGNGPVQVVTNPNAPAPPAGCTTLDMAAWTAGQTFYDAATGVQFTVQSAGAYGDTVNAVKW